MGKTSGWEVNMAWRTVAEGTSLDELAQLVADMELPKGARVKVVMNTWAPWLFDMAGAELLMRVWPALLTGFSR